MALSITQTVPTGTTATVRSLGVAKVSGGEANGSVNVSIVQDSVEIRTAVLKLDQAGEATVTYEYPLEGTYSFKAFLGEEAVSTANVVVS